MLGRRNDMVQFDYDEVEGILTLNLPKDTLAKIDRVVITKNLNEVVGTAHLERGYKTNGEYGRFKKESGATE